MDDEIKWQNLRKHPRIAWNFVVKFRLKDNPDLNWQVSTVKDISEGGCFFYSNVSYEIGQHLDIRIQFPSLGVPMEFTGEVKRCEERKSGELKMFGLGVLFLEIDEEKKKQFIDTIIFFLKKKKA